jgi:hypothetical protein
LLLIPATGDVEHLGGGQLRVTYDGEVAEGTAWDLMAAAVSITFAGANVHDQAGTVTG